MATTSWPSSEGGVVRAEPLCSSCGHTHFPDRKCTICGHDGHILVFPGPDGPHPPPSTFHLTAFDASSCSTSSLAGMFALVRIMRTRVFVTELGGKGDIDELDASCRHILGLIGEAPVAYARWRVVPTAMLEHPGQAPANGPVTVLIERFLVLSNYRNRKFGKQLLQHAVLDAAQRVLGSSERPLSKVSLFIPSTPAFEAAAKAALAIGMKVTGSERPDPTGWWTHAPVWEFSVAGGDLQQAIVAQQAAAATGRPAAGQ